jgi:hypothetical protein
MAVDSSGHLNDRLDKIQNDLPVIDEIVNRAFRSKIPISKSAMPKKPEQETEAGSKCEPSDRGPSPSGSPTPSSYPTAAPGLIHQVLMDKKPLKYLNFQEKHQMMLKNNEATWFFRKKRNSSQSGKTIL